MCARVGEVKCVQSFGGGTYRIEAAWKTCLGMGGRIGFVGVDWIFLVQDTEELPAVVNTVMDLLVPLYIYIYIYI
jgi:hypothetical protein